MLAEYNNMIDTNQTTTDYDCVGLGLVLGVFECRAKKACVTKIGIVLTSYWHVNGLFESIARRLAQDPAEMEEFRMVLSHRSQVWLAGGLPCLERKVRI